MALAVLYSFFGPGWVGVMMKNRDWRCGGFIGRRGMFHDICCGERSRDSGVMERICGIRDSTSLALRPRIEIASGVVRIAEK